MIASHVAERRSAGIMPEMTERSLADRPIACPFLAFDEDRDFRADRPDHRHRCFAETRPAPRAISHQELFCLGGAFAECPTFAAWAAREAAAVRRPTIREADRTRTPTGAPPVGRAAPAAGTAAAAAAAGSASAAERDWLAPPPWVSDDPATESGEPGELDEGPGRVSWDDGPAPAATPAPTRVAHAWSEPPDVGATPPFLAGRASTPERSSVPTPPPSSATADDDLAGLVGAAGAAAAGGAAATAAADPGWPPQPATRSGAQPVSGTASPPPPTGYSSAAARATAEPAPGPDSPWIHAEALEPGDDMVWEDAVEAAAAGRVARSRRDDRNARSGGSRFGRSRPPTSGQARPLPERVADPSAPAWERPRSLEAYPAIKSTRRPLGVPRVAIWAGLLLAAALVLFLVPPIFLGGGKGGGSATPAPSASADVSAAPAPTATPAPHPTPFTYKVKAGDTLSRIAGKYKVAVADIIAANPAMKDPNRLQIGDVLVIPLPASSVIPDAGTPAVPSGSAAP